MKQKIKLNKVLIIFLIFISPRLWAQEAPSTQLITDTNYIYRSLSMALQNIDNVYRLNLSKTKLKAIPPDVFKLKNLHELDVSRNKLDSVPAEIGMLTNLTILNLSNNNLELLPDEIGNLNNLNYLNLNRNKIVALPRSIGNLSNLERLDLWDNELSEIPDEISKLKKLKVLELRGILFSEEEAARIDSLLPEAKVYLSPTCNCK